MAIKILLITQVFYPDEVSTASLFTNLCSELVKKSVDVEVWCAHPSYTHTEKQSRKLIFNGINITFLSSTNFKKTFITGRLINYLSFTLSVLLKLLFSKDKTTVLTHTTPPALGIILSFICSIKKRKFIYVLLDIFPEGLIRLGKISRMNILVRFWRYMFRLSLRRCDKIVVIGRDMQRWIEGVTGKNISKPEYIPLWHDDELIFPLDYTANELVKEYGLQEKFVVQYSGNMGLWNDMKVFGSAVRRNPEEIVFMFVGGGMRMKDLMDSFSMKEQKNVIMLPFQPNKEIRKTLTACHAGLVSLHEGLEGMAVPSKIYGIMAAGIPVIALVPDESEIAYIIREEGCGIVVNQNEKNGLIDAITLLKSDENARVLMGRNGRKAFEKKYTAKKVAEKYSMMFNELQQLR